MKFFIIIILLSFIVTLGRLYEKIFFLFVCYNKFICFKKFIKNNVLLNES